MSDTMRIAGTLRLIDGVLRTPKDGLRTAEGVQKTLRAMESAQKALQAVVLANPTLRTPKDGLRMVERVLQNTITHLRTAEGVRYTLRTLKKAQKALKTLAAGR